MSKRRLNIQQQRRVKQHQDKFEQTDALNALTGRVIARYARNAEIEDDSEQRRICSIRPNIDSLVAGDRILWLEEDPAHGVIVQRLDRQSELMRYNKQGQAKVIAANLTQMCIMVAPLPEPSFEIIDNYLLAAEVLGLKAILILNKIDLPCDALKQKLQEVYAPLAYPLFMLQQDEEASLKGLLTNLQNETNVIVGQSGVGKSSLISRLLPEDDSIRTGEISDIAKLGKHTTSTSRFYHLPSGGALIDSPGVREYQPGPIERQDIIRGFKDIAPFTQSCKFRDCDHFQAPGCAVRSALESGQLKESRYQTFIKHLLED